MIPPCEDESRSDLLALLENELSPSDARKLRLHFDECERCRAAFHSLVRADAALLASKLPAHAVFQGIETATDYPRSNHSQETAPLSDDELVERFSPRQSALPSEQLPDFLNKEFARMFPDSDQPRSETAPEGTPSARDATREKEFDGFTAAAAPVRLDTAREKKRGGFRARIPLFGVGAALAAVLVLALWPAGKQGVQELNPRDTGILERERVRSVPAPRAAGLSESVGAPGSPQPQREEKKRFPAMAQEPVPQPSAAAPEGKLESASSPLESSPQQALTDSPSLRLGETKPAVGGVKLRGDSSSRQPEKDSAPAEKRSNAVAKAKRESVHAPAPMESRERTSKDEELRVPNAPDHPMPLHTLDIFGNLVSLRIRDEAGTPLDLPGLDARSSARKDSPLGYKESGLVPKYTISVVVVNRETCCDLEGSIVAVPEGRELAVIKESCVSKDDLTGRAFDLAGKLVKAASEDARIPTR